MDIALQQAATKAPELVALVVLVVAFLFYLRFLANRDEARAVRHEELEKIRIAVFDRVAGALDRNTSAFERTDAVLGRIEKKLEG